MQRILLLITMMFMTVIINAQDDKWYYAFDEETHTVIAYTLSGDIEVVVERVTSISFQPFKLSNGNILVTVNDEAVYLISETDAQQLDTLSSFPISGNSDYLVLTSSFTFGNHPIALLNVNLGNVEMLMGITPTMITSFQNPCCRFSEDGRFLYYVSSGDDAETWALIRRDLTSGDEQSIHIFENAGAFLSFNSSDYGEYWFYRILGSKGEYVLFRVDGTIERLPLNGENGDLYARRLFDDSIITYDFGCEVDCELEIQSLLDGKILIYDWFFDFEAGALPDLLIQPTPESLLIFQDNNFWSVVIGEMPQLVGFWNSIRMGPIANQLLSPNERWLVVQNSFEEPDEYRIWDVDNRQMVANQSYEAQFIFAVYREFGLLISDFQNFTNLHLFRAMDEVIELPMQEGRGYIDVVSEDTLLMFDNGEGISVFNFVTGEETLLIEGARLQPLLPVEIH